MIASFGSYMSAFGLIFLFTSALFTALTTTNSKTVNNK
jgi:hypothetical protein